MKNRLQFRHNDTLFTNSEQAKAYIESQMKGASGKIALYGEPIVAKSIVTGKQGIIMSK